MTFSICVHETYPDAEDPEQMHDRFGVAVTTRLPCVGTLCPHASDRAAVATQSLINVDLGRRGVRYVDEGLGIGDALQSLLNADSGRESRQLHGVDAEDTFAFSGKDCQDWFGHTTGDSYTVAGNMLTDETVIDKTAAAYENGDPDDRLAERLIDALAAGHAAGGDKREELRVQSAALLVRTTETYARAPYYNDLRVDATETPIEDLRDTYALAVEGYEAAMARHGDAIRADAFKE